MVQVDLIKKDPFSGCNTLHPLREIMMIEIVIVIIGMRIGVNKVIIVRIVIAVIIITIV